MDMVIIYEGFYRFTEMETSKWVNAPESLPCGDAKISFVPRHGSGK